jgi:hypothetical protein
MPSDRTCVREVDVGYYSLPCGECATMWVTFGNGPPTPMCAECADIVEPWASSIVPMGAVCDE